MAGNLVAFLTPAQQDELRPHGARVGARVAARLAANAILSEHAPQLAEGVAGSSLSPAGRKAIQTAIAAITDERGRIRVHRDIDAVILRGNAAGLWDIQSLGICAQHLLAPSRIVVGNEVEGARLARWRSALCAELPRLMRCEVATEVAGAVLVAAVIFDAQLNSELLPQLLEPGEPPDKLPAGTWVTFLHGAAKDARGMPRCRRALLGEVTGALLDRWWKIRSERGHAPAASACIASVGKRLGMHGPRNLADLMACARGYWALHLSPIAYDAAVAAVATESLPRHAVRRLLSGRGLHPRDRPISRREALRREGRRRRSGEQLGALGEFSKDIGLAVAAFRKLRRIFWVPKGQRLPKAKDIAAELERWTADFGALGGWIALLGLWAAHLGSTRRTSGNGKPLNVRSIHTFLSSFGRWFLSLAGDLSPADADSAEFLERLDMLQLASFRGASSTGRRAFTEFLVFAERFGAPRVDLVDRWGAMNADGRPDANVVSPVEFRRLLDAIDKCFEGFTDSFDCRRARTLAIIAYRAGARWSELHSLPLRHVRDLGVGRHRETTLLVLETEFREGKTANAERALPLDKLLPPRELTEVRSFLADVANGRWHAVVEGQLVFADPRAPTLPPDEADTHDLIQRLMRQVTGDYTLVFHHLRHSAATFMLLRALLDPHAPALTPALVDATLAPAPGFESHAHWLTGRPDGLHSAATAVAKLMGHIDFQVTCFHYVHLMELVISQEARRTHPPLCDKAVAAIEGVNVATIHQRRWLQGRN